MKNVYVVTGGSSGIGLEIAKELTEGLVLITGRNQDKLDLAKANLEEAGIEVATKTSDISKRESLDELFSYANSLGTIKTVINSAGVSGVGVNARLAYSIDLIGTQNLIELAQDHLEKGSSIILIASMMGYVVADGDYNKFLMDPSAPGAIDALMEVVNEDSNLAYNFSKKGVHLMVKKYAPVLGKKGIRILSVSPGIIQTPMTEVAVKEHPDQMDYMLSMSPLNRMGQVYDIANSVVFLASDKASFITGIDLPVDGGLTLKLPGLMGAQAAK